MLSRVGVYTWHANNQEPARSNRAIYLKSCLIQKLSLTLSNTFIDFSLMR